MAGRTRRAVRAIDAKIRELYPDNGIEAVMIATGEDPTYIRRRVGVLKVRMSPSKTRTINRLKGQCRIQADRINSLEIEIRSCKQEIKRYRELFDERV